MSDTSRIASVTLDEASIAKRSVEAEHERQVAITDLISTGSITVTDPQFLPIAGPFELTIGVRDGRLLLTLVGEQHNECRIALAVNPLRALIRDYFLICESYYEAIQSSSRERIQTVDMARRGLHNEAGEMLQSQLDGSLLMDHATARRLFTLICVLHLR